MLTRMHTRSYMGFTPQTSDQDPAQPLSILCPESLGLLAAPVLGSSPTSVLGAPRDPDGGDREPLFSPPCSRGSRPAGTVTARGTLTCLLLSTHVAARPSTTRRQPRARATGKVKSAS